METSAHEHPFGTEPESFGDSLINGAFYTAMGVWFLAVVTIIMAWSFGPK
jgi:hypothetical protein